MEGVSSYNQEKISIQDPEEAKDFIEEALERGERPCITIPTQYFSAVKNGLRASHVSWDGFPFIVATIVRGPYLPNDGQNRKIVRIKNIDPERIQPRKTGEDEAFHGVVVIHGIVRPEDIEEVIN